MDIQLQNLLSLEARYGQRERFETLLDNLRPGLILKEDEIDYTSTVSDTEKTGLVDGFDHAIDSLLTFYSLIEIGRIAAIFPDPLPVRFQISILSFLQNPIVSTKLKDHGTSALVRALYDELRVGYLHLDRDNTESAAERAALFAAFLDINSLIENDENVSEFVRLLGKSNDKFRLDLIFRLSRLTNVEYLESRLMAKEPQEDDQRFAAGLDTFLLFCSSFADLLRRANRYVTLQSAFWCYHSGIFISRKDELSKEVLRYIWDIGGLQPSGASVQKSDSNETQQAAAKQIIDSLTYLLDSNHHIALDAHRAKLGYNVVSNMLERIEMSNKTDNIKGVVGRFKGIAGEVTGIFTGGMLTGKSNIPDMDDMENAVWKELQNLGFVRPNAETEETVGRYVKPMTEFEDIIEVYSRTLKLNDYIRTLKVGRSKSNPSASRRANLLLEEP